jgi:hypothetical protein
MKSDSRVANLFVAGGAAALWLAICGLTVNTPLSPAIAAGVLLVMTATLRLGFREWKISWLQAAFSAGVIGLVALLCAAVAARL